jgi:hypothetical protein
LPPIHRDADKRSSRKPKLPVLHVSWPQHNRYSLLVTSLCPGPIEVIFSENYGRSPVRSCLRITPAFTPAPNKTPKANQKAIDARLGCGAFIALPDKIPTSTTRGNPPSGSQNPIDPAVDSPQPKRRNALSIKKLPIISLTEIDSS